MSVKRILWINREASDPTAGDVVYDSKLRNSIAPGFEVNVLTMSHSPRNSLRLARLMVQGVPHDRASFAHSGNLAAFREAQASGSYDVIVLSHECFDWILPYTNLPTVLVLHNVTSAYMRSAWPGQPRGELLARWYSRYERRRYASRVGLRLVCLSRCDQSYLEQLVGSEGLFLAPPGMPSAVFLSPDARVEPKLVVSGSFDWAPKRRDLLRFAHEYSRERPDLCPLISSHLPSEAVELLYDAQRGDADSGRSIRFGLVTDRFEAGFKLKVGSHIAANMITLTFSDVLGDYDGIPHADEFIIRVDSINEMASIIGRAGELGREEVSKFSRFKEAAINRFTWKATAEAVESAIESLFC